MPQLDGTGRLLDADANADPVTVNHCNNGIVAERDARGVVLVVGRLYHVGFRRVGRENQACGIFARNEGRRGHVAPIVAGHSREVIDTVLLADDEEDRAAVKRVALCLILGRLCVGAADHVVVLCGFAEVELSVEPNIVGIVVAVPEVLDRRKLPLAGGSIQHGNRGMFVFIHVDARGQAIDILGHMHVKQVRHHFGVGRCDDIVKGIAFRRECQKRKHHK